jgi:hypothetical protein
MYNLFPEDTAKNAFTETLFIEYWKSKGKIISSEIFQDFKNRYGISYEEFISKIKNFKDIRKAFINFVDKSIGENLDGWRGIFRTILNDLPENVISGIKKRSVSDWLIYYIDKLKALREKVIEY